MVWITSWRNARLPSTYRFPFSRRRVASAVESWKTYGEIRVASRESGPTGGGLTEDVKMHRARCVE